MVGRAAACKGSAGGSPPHPIPPDPPLSGRQPLDAPGAVRRARIANAVVQTARASLPELDRPRRNAIAAPVRRQRNLLADILDFERGHPLLQLRPAAEHGALV